MPIVSRDNVIKTALLFCLLTGICAIIPYYLSIEFGLRRYYVAFLMWTPALGTFATCKIMGLNLRSLPWSWPSGKWLTVAYTAPILYGLIAYGMLWGFNLGGLFDAKFVDELGYIFALSGWSENATILFGVVMIGSVGLLWHLITSVGEEIGWRGFLTPILLERFSIPVTSVIVGFVWSTWHYPLIFFTDYNAGPTNLVMQAANFTLMSIGISYMMTQLTVRSASLWPATLMHAAHNVFILRLFQPATIHYDGTSFYAGEFGIILPAVTSLGALAVWYYTRKDELSAPVQAVDTGSKE